MNTVFGLMATFGSSEIPLEAVCEQFLGLSKRAAFRQAHLHQLPFPAYRLGSNKSPWLVSAADLAAYIDEKREEAKEQWTKLTEATVL